MDLIFIYAIIAVLLVVLTVWIAARLIRKRTESPERSAGRAGEQYAAKIIKSVLHEGDLLFTNVEITYEDKTTELDNVVVNRNGVFIIEVKNYSGLLKGSEEDFEWMKYHRSRGGNMYVKAVKNPIKQVKRQIYILAKYLDYYGSQVWVEGYAIILNARSPVNSNYILSNISDIDRAIHSHRSKCLNSETVDAVANLLK